MGPAGVADQGLGQGLSAPPEDPEEPCTCDPGPGPVEVVVGDGFECVGANSGTLTLDGRVVRVTVHYCKPWFNDPVLLP